MIELPWPPKQLSPNFRSRSHWPRTNALAKARGWAKVATMGAKIGPIPDGAIKVVIGCYPPTAHARDKDNLQASCKAYLDGIADALGVNDARFDPSVVVGEPVKHGKIVVVLG